MRLFLDVGNSPDVLIYASKRDRIDHVSTQGVSVEMGQNATVNKGCRTEKIDIGDVVSKTSCYGVTGVSFRRLEGRQSTVLMDSSE